MYLDITSSFHRHIQLYGIYNLSDPKMIINTKHETTHSIDEIFNDILEQNDILSILRRKMEPNLLASKTERKGDHDVFDDGNNNNRIYYFIDAGKMYIYKTFQNEEKAQKYIKEPFKEIHRKNFKSSSKRFKILI